MNGAVVHRSSGRVRSSGATEESEFQSVSKTTSVRERQVRAKAVRSQRRSDCRDLYQSNKWIWHMRVTISGGKELRVGELEPIPGASVCGTGHREDDGINVSRSGSAVVHPGGCAGNIERYVPDTSDSRVAVVCDMAPTPEAIQRDGRPQATWCSFRISQNPFEARPLVHIPSNPEAPPANSEPKQRSNISDSTGMDTAGVNVNKNEIKSPCTAQREVVKIQREGARRAGGPPARIRPARAGPRKQQAGG